MKDLTPQPSRVMLPCSWFLNLNSDLQDKLYGIPMLCGRTVAVKNSALTNMLTLRTHIQIAATPERVWNILMDFPSHRQWNPFVRSLEGTSRVGETLKVFIQPPGSRGMQFRPKVPGLPQLRVHHQSSSSSSSVTAKPSSAARNSSDVAASSRLVLMLVLMDLSSRMRLSAMWRTSARLWAM